MSNVLDLKDRDVGSSDAIPLVAEVIAAPQTPIGVAESGDEEIPEATLAAADFPTSVEWTAHHPLEGAAQKRHVYLSGGIVAVGALVSLWQGSPSAFLVLLIGAGALEIRERMSRPTSVVVNERGITIDEQRYPHAAFSSFHIHRMPDETLELSLQSEQRYLPHLRLPLGPQDPYKLHAVLAQYIPEGEHKIPYVDYYLRKPRE